MTTEQKLRAVIEAQAKGGFHENDLALKTGFTLDDFYVVPTGFEIAAVHVLEILLDPEGLKAAYPGIAGEARMGIVLAAILNKIKNGQLVMNADLSAHLILDSWLSGGATAAIDTAFTLLP